MPDDQTIQPEPRRPVARGYALADDHAAPTNGHAVAEPPEREAPARRVRTTLGRGREQRDADSEMVAGAFRPGRLRVRQQPEPEVIGPTPLPKPTPRPEPFNRLQPLVPREPVYKRLIFAATAWAFAGLFLWAMLAFWAPAHTGVDQNGYLVGGKLLARNGTMSYVPDSPYGFVGNMWVATDRPVTTPDGQTVQEYFPKYPAGLPLLYASFFWLAPSETAAMETCHLVSPVAACLAVLGMFYLGRFAGGSFVGSLAMLGLAGSQLLLMLAANPNSHAAALAFVVWGFVALFAWWRSGNVLLGIAAGFLLGYAFTIRYTEGLLGLPLGLTCLFAFNYKRPFASGWRVLMPLIGWAIPVAALLVYNVRTMGSLTGYDSTGEAAGFSWQNVLDNWETVAKQFNDAGLYFLLPLGVAGLLALAARRARLGAVILAWFVGTVGVYTAYYWAPADWGDTAYLRFFLTAFPAVLIGAAYLLRRVLYAPSDADAPGRPQRWRSVFAPVAAGLVVTVSVGVGAHRAVGSLPAGTNGPFAEFGLQLQHNLNANTAELGRLVRKTVPAGSVLFVSAPGFIDNATHHLQFVGDHELYDANMFSTSFARTVRGGFRRAGDEDSPNPLQKRRYEFLKTLYDGKSDADLSGDVRGIVDRALDEGREIYLLMSETEQRKFARDHLREGDYETSEAATFLTTPLTRPADEDAGAEESRERRRRRRGLLAMVAATYANERNWTITRVAGERPVTAPTTQP